jgi:hypothetical protein
MNVQQALWYMIEKNHFNNYDFTDEFIEKIKTIPEYDGLYNILDLSICKKFNFQRNLHPTLLGVKTDECCSPFLQKEIKASNPYPLVQLLINYYNSHESIFQFEEDYNYAKQILAIIYEELDKIFKRNKDDSDPNTNILILVSYVLTYKIEEIHEYLDHPIVQKCVSFCDMNKVFRTKNIDLIKKQTDIFEKKYPNIATQWIEYNVTKLQMANDKQDIKCIAKCSDILFPNKKMQMYSDILYFTDLCSELQRLRIEKKYEYAEYPVNKPPYEDFTDMYDAGIQIVRLTFETDIKKDNSNYISYLKKLLENSSKFINSVFSDYIIMVFNTRNYLEVYNIFRKFKKYILHKIRITAHTLVKLNLIFVIIVSCNNVNRNASIKEFNDIMANIKPKDYVDTGLIKNMHDKINIIINRTKKRDSEITLLGFNIVDKSKVDETCLICIEEIDDSNMETVECICCKKELGHIGCVCIWIKTNQTCPNCRASVKDRLSMRE